MEDEMSVEAQITQPMVQKSNTIKSVFLRPQKIEESKDQLDGQGDDGSGNNDEQAIDDGLGAGGDETKEDGHKRLKTIDIGPEQYSVQPHRQVK